MGGKYPNVDVEIEAVGGKVGGGGRVDEEVVDTFVAFV